MGLETDQRGDAPIAAPVSRTRTVSWHDPSVFIEHLTKMSGAERAEIGVAGRIERFPLAELLDMRAVRWEPGSMTLAVSPAEFHSGAAGVVHGGVAATLLDTAMGLALDTLLPINSGVATLSMDVRFMRAIPVALDEIECCGRVLHAGSRIVTTEGRIIDADGRLYAAGSGTYSAIGGRPAPLPREH